MDHHNDDMIKRLLNGLFLCQPELQRLKKIIVMPFQNGIILKFVVLLCSSCIKSPVSCYCYSSFIFSATPDLCQLSLFTFLHCRNPLVGAEVLMVYSHSVPYMYTELQLLGSHLQLHCPVRATKRQTNMQHACQVQETQINAPVRPC